MKFLTTFFRRYRPFARYCLIARACILLVLLGLSLLLGGLYFIGPVFVGVGGSPRGLGQYLLGSLAIWHHTLLFMAALWFLQRTAGGLMQDELNGQRLSRHLALAGWLLMLGALAGAVSRPLLLHSDAFARLLAEQGLQFPVYTSRLADVYVAAAVIGLVGLLMVLVSRVLRLQAAAAAELRQIF